MKNKFVSFSLDQSFAGRSIKLGYERTRKNITDKMTATRFHLYEDPVLARWHRKKLRTADIVSILNEGYATPY